MPVQAGGGVVVHMVEVTDLNFRSVGRGWLTLTGQQRQEIDELWTDVGVGIIALSNKQVSDNFLFCLCMTH